jgi:hypothetical protein
MKVTEVTDRSSQWGTTSQETHEVTLTPVAGEENKTWAKYTPGGSIKLTINNPDAFNQFAIGQTFFVDFSPAPATEAEEHAG